MFRVLELNRKLARLVLAEKVDLVTHGPDSVVHKYREKRAAVEKMEKEIRGEASQNKQKMRSNWNSGFGRKFSSPSRNNSFPDRFSRRQFYQRKNNATEQFSNDVD